MKKMDAYTHNGMVLCHKEKKKTMLPGNWIEPEIIESREISQILENKGRVFFLTCGIRRAHESTASIVKVKGKGWRDRHNKNRRG